jgi:hypothetical protein
MSLAGCFTGQAASLRWTIRGVLSRYGWNWKRRDSFY